MLVIDMVYHAACRGNRHHHAVVSAGDATAGHAGVENPYILVGRIAAPHAVKHLYKIPVALPVHLLQLYRHYTGLIKSTCAEEERIRIEAAQYVAHVAGHHRFELKNVADK